MKSLFFMFCMFISVVCQGAIDDPIVVYIGSGEEGKGIFIENYGNVNFSCIIYNKTTDGFTFTMSKPHTSILVTFEDPETDVLVECGQVLSI